MSEDRAPYHTPRRLRLFLSGPINGHADRNAPAFDAAEERLREAGYDVTNPLDLHGPRADLTESKRSEYLKTDIRALLECDGLCLLPGWRNSNGAACEKLIAETLGLRVSTVDVWAARGEVEQKALRIRAAAQAESRAPARQDAAETRDSAKRGIPSASGVSASTEAKVSE